MMAEINLRTIGFDCHNTIFRILLPTEYVNNQDTQYALILALRLFSFIVFSVLDSVSNSEIFHGSFSSLYLIFMVNITPPHGYQPSHFYFYQPCFIRSLRAFCRLLIDLWYPLVLLELIFSFPVSSSLHSLLSSEGQKTST